MPIRPLHNLESLNNEIVWYFFMEQIAHAIDEDLPWLLPPEWECQLIFV